MSLVINHNLMAANTARTLGNTYDRLSTSVERLSSGLRINSAADDAAGLAIRELMRADIASMQQGIRNAADAISMIQTADGAMAVIDEKLVRMKELAEQAATGTYTTLQREIINSEYQAMAAEIDRIANATNFNGVRLLDGSITNLHGGQGMKIHFGTGNDPSEDYYFINTGDVRATSSTGLRIGGDAKNDIWGQGAAGAKGLAGPGCCTAGYGSLDGPAGFRSGETFSYGYNWNWMEDDDPDLLKGRYLAGRYAVTSSDSLQDLIDKVNKGTQSRVGVRLDSSALALAVKAGGTAAVCLGDEAYIFGSASVAGGTTVIPAVSGKIYRFLAEGSFDDDGFRHSATLALGPGVGLTRAQYQLLSAAGIDLSPLGLVPAAVSASASSTVSSAQARYRLLMGLTQAWAALGLDRLSALTLSAGVVKGFSVTSSAVIANAVSGTNVSGSGAAAIIMSGESLVVRTGVWADEHGNWTDDRRIGSALGWDEVIVEFAHNDVTLYSYRATAAASKDILVNPEDGISAWMTSASFKDMAAAGISPEALATFVFGTAPALSENLEDSANARTDFLADYSDNWSIKYAELDAKFRFNSATGQDLTGPTAAGFLASAESDNAWTAITPPLTVTSPLSALATAGDIKIHTGYYVDSEGNFTSSPQAADVFGMTEIVYILGITDPGTGTAVFNASLSGMTLNGWAEGTDPLCGIDPNGDLSVPSYASTISDLAQAIQGSLRHQIATRQGTPTTPLTKGRVYLDAGPAYSPPPSPNSLDVLSAATYQKVITPPSPLLNVNVEIAGLTSAYTSASLLLPRVSTALGELAPVAMAAVTAVLAALQKDAASPGGLANMGRLRLGAPEAPAGPLDLSDIDNPTLTSALFWAALDRTVATGHYADSGFAYSSAKGYGLSSAQLSALARAMLDLSALGLVPALVSASASSTAGSASARQALLGKLQGLWSALALDKLTALEILSGVSTGFSGLTVQKVAASAAPGALVAVNGGTGINQRSNVVIHTGVYADEHGNWTNDRKLAADLGLREMTFTVRNDNYTWRTQSATFRSPDWLVYSAAGLIMNPETAQSLGNAGFGTLLAMRFAEASATGHGTAATSAQCSAALYADVRDRLAARYPDPLDLVTFTPGNPSGTRAFSWTDIYRAASNPAVAFTGYDSDAFLNPGLANTELVISAGVFMDANGNYTNDRELASAFGLNELVVRVYTNAAGTYTWQVKSLTSTAYTTIPAVAGMPTAAGTSLETMANALTAYIRSRVSTAQTAGAALGLTPGQISSDSRQAIPPLTVPYFRDAANSTIEDMKENDLYPDNDPSWLLQASVNYAGASSPLIQAMAFPPSTTLATLAGFFTAEIEAQLASHQNLAILIPNQEGMGRIVRTASDPHGGPADEIQIGNLLTEDVWKDAADAQTVTKTGIIDKTKHVTLVASAGTPYFDASGISNFGARALASAINHNPDSRFWAMVQDVDSQGNPAEMVYVFLRDGGDHNDLLACDVAAGDLPSRDALAAIQFENAETARMNQSGTGFSLGGESWGTLKPLQTKAGMGREVWNLTLHGRDVGKERDLWIAAVADGVNEIDTPGLRAGIINGLDRYSFVEIQNAADGDWAGAEVRTQSSAQEALDAVNDAMARKDKVRADIGALQNRLENTITNLEIQLEALQASESRISDADIAIEMTEFVRNQVLAQAAVAMLSQANSLPQMALSLLNG